MKAIRVHTYGPPERLTYEDLPDPRPQPMEVVIEVAASAVNPADCKFRSGALAAGNPKGLPFVPGMDIAGSVLRIGERVKGFRIGDRVLAMLYLMGNGGYAEQVAVPVEWCVFTPPSLDALAAASLPTPAITAAQLIEDDLCVRSGHSVLITGATGAVGLIACFVAKQLGAHVTAAVRASQVSSVRYADDVLILDTAPSASHKMYDCIADTIGGITATALLRVLRAGGVLSTIATDPVVNTRQSEVTTRFFGNHPDALRLAQIAAAVAEGRLIIPPAKIMSLSQASSAHELLERGGAGKIVLIPDRLGQPKIN